MHLGLLTSSATAIPHDISAAIPSPSISSFQLGPLTIHFYALCILVGIIFAIVLTNRRLTKLGVEDWQVLDIATLAVPMAIVFARIYHVITHYTDYFGPGRNPWNPFEPGSVWAIWEGGIAIFGSLIGGTLGAWIMCRRLGLKLTTLLDALAPGLILAQACGRFGNWFNQELFGLPTTLPWGLEIDPGNPAIPLGTPPGTLFHPTFLYEVIWNSLGALVLLYLGRHVFFQWDDSSPSTSCGTAPDASSGNRSASTRASSSSACGQMCGARSVRSLSVWRSCSSSGNATPSPRSHRSSPAAPPTQ